MFISGDLSVFAYEYNGTVLAWLYRPDLAGANRFNDTGPVGQSHIQAMINVSRAGGGMVDYYMTDPFST